jgi:hypothetical protein
MSTELRLLWKGERRAIYAVETRTTLLGKRVRRVGYLSAKLGGWKWRRVSPRFGQELERLMQGRMKVLGSWFRSLIGEDVKALQAAIKASLRVEKLANIGAYARRVLDELSDTEWAQLRAKASYIARSVKSRIGIEFQEKGLIHEIAGIRRMFDPKTISTEARAELEAMEKMVREAPDSHRWNPEIFMFERAYTRSKSGGGEVGDKLFVVFRDPKNPRKGMWVVGVGNQKSAGNAHHLLSHRSFINLDPTLPDEGIPKYGESLGQGSIDVERISELGVEVPGVGRFSSAPGPNEGKLKVSWKNCRRIGVVPIDTHPKVLQQLRDLAMRDPSFRLLLSELPDREAARIADMVIRSVE